MSAFKYSLAYRLTVTNSQQNYVGWGGEYAHVYIEVMMGSKLNAAKEYDHNPTAYHLERLQKIRSEGTSATYFSKSDYLGFTLRWQADKEGWEKYEKDSRWYGCYCEDAKIDVASAKLFAKICAKLQGSWGTSPQMALAALRELGAQPVKYGECYNSWIYLDRSPAEEDAMITANPFELPKPEATKDLKAPEAE